MFECPFCKRDPYHYVDNGVGWEPVAIVCCETMIGLSRDEKKAKQVLRLRRRGTPRSVARGNRIWFEVYGEGPLTRDRGDE